MTEINLEKEIKIAALENAVKFNGKANQGAVIGKLFSLDASLKSQMKEIAPMIGKLLSQINSMEPSAQHDMLNELAPNLEAEKAQLKKDRKEKRSELPELRGAEMGKVITRMPPGPSKYLHIGHAISMGINYLYSKMYDGKCVLRFDDTNPDAEKQEFVESIMDDLKNYLEFEADEVIFASDNIPKLIKMADDLVSQDKAYICNCPSENISLNRREMKTCSHRELSIDENKRIWDEMKKGNDEFSHYILRLKIDMEHKNAVMRDPAIFRVVTTPHYRQGDKFKVWPLYDFESAIMDGIIGTTNVLRSNEFDMRIELHEYIVDLFGLPKSNYKHYGRSSITGATTKGREIRALIDSGDYLGWDDPRLVTLKALKRRGIVRDAIINLVKKAGLSKSNTNIDFDVISAENRKILDKTAKRFFLIENKVEVSINGSPEKELIIPMHPEMDLGTRTFYLNSEFLINKKDYDDISEGELIRLIDAVNFKDFEFDSEDFEDYKGKGDKIIHFLPNDPEQIVNVEVRMPDNTLLNCVAEKAIETLKIGDVIQFQRFGFCRLDAVEDGKFKFWYTHD